MGLTSLQTLQQDWNCSLKLRKGNIDFVSRSLHNAQTVSSERKGCGRENSRTLTIQGDHFNNSTLTAQPVSQVDQ